MRLPAILVSLSLASLLWSDVARAAPFSCAGHGSQTSHKAIGAGNLFSPYRLCAPAQLKSLGYAPNDWGKVYSLEADLDMYGYSAATLKPIGNLARAFSGTFHGNGHQIYHFTLIAPTVSYVGIFGYVTGTIDDLFVGADVEGWSYVGELVGLVGTGATVANVHVQGGSVKDNTFSGGCGGLAGVLRGGTIVARASTVPPSPATWAWAGSSATSAEAR